MLWADRQDLNGRDTLEWRRLPLCGDELRGANQCGCGDVQGVYGAQIQLFGRENVPPSLLNSHGSSGGTLCVPLIRLARRLVGSQESHHCHARVNRVVQALVGGPEVTSFSLCQCKVIGIVGGTQVEFLGQL